MPNCNLCQQYVERRTALKKKFEQEKDQKRKLLIGRQWKELKQYEDVMVCQSCYQQVSQVMQFPTVPTHRPGTAKITKKSCEYCQHASDELDRLRLYNNKTFWQRDYNGCVECLKNCTGGNTCHKYQTTAEYLQRLLIKNLPETQRRLR